MSKTGMAKHSLSSFNEKSATRMLSDYLEQKHTIATFFKENDRTPNYDGSFELVGKDESPTKQFIVQIKKVENLAPNTKGDNKGCYMYNLDTSFLYYVKEKVTESPAIYFIVDIATYNIFWLYLSDEFLMNSNFEGKEYLYLPLKETDIVPDIDTFINILNQIVAKRNSLFLKKTPEQIAEMQEALDYINSFMENDFSNIKENVFPNLWRFGIKYTPGETMSITANGHTMTSDAASMFALYPQIKGVPDTGLQEYSGNYSNFFNHFDMLGKTSPMDYTKDSLHKIIKTFFENEIPAALLPDIMILERLNNFVNKLDRFYDFDIKNGKILITELYRAYVLLLRYIQYIVLEPNIEEIEIKAEITARFNRGERNYFDIFRCSSNVAEHYKSFCLKHKYDDKLGFAPDLVFKIVPKYQIESFVDVAELEQRKVKYYESVWNYNYFEIVKLNPDEFMEQINQICEKWFAELPAIYNGLYDKLLEKNKYKIKGNFKYRNEYFSNGRCGPWFSSIVREYKSDTFCIEYAPNCSDDFNEEDKKNGLLSINSGFLIERFLQRKNLFYDASRCLLYQGICKELGYKTKGLSFDGMNYSLF